MSNADKSKNVPSHMIGMINNKGEITEYLEVKLPYFSYVRQVRCHIHSFPASPTITFGQIVVGKGRSSISDQNETLSYETIIIILRICVVPNR